MIMQGKLFSRALEMETGLAVLAPDDPDCKGPYRVVYLLHGTCGSGSNFLYDSMLPVYAAGRNCVFVMPDTVRSLYADMAVGQAYFTYVAEELPAVCRNLFHISTRREDCFVIGNSSGGYGALKCALTFPERYAACCASAPGALHLREFLGGLQRDGITQEALDACGEGILRDMRAAFGERYQCGPGDDLLELARKVEPANCPELLVQIGREDFMLEPNRLFAQKLRELPLPFTYQETDGAHDFYFFDRALQRALEFCLG